MLHTEELITCFFLQISKIPCNLEANLYLLGVCEAFVCERCLTVVQLREKCKLSRQQNLFICQFQTCETSPQLAFGHMTSEHSNGHVSDVQ